ncbi:MAG: hypothetical protein QM775_27400 [Pirellulales bacterium]
MLVVWAFDQSESMVDDREEIQGRVDRVYQELGLSAAAKDDALLTGVISYGASTLNHTPQPTYKPEEIMAAIKAVPTDPSGAGNAVHGAELLHGQLSKGRHERQSSDGHRDGQRRKRRHEHEHFAT